MSKKWLIGIGSILILSIGSLYIFIPSKIRVSFKLRMNCNAAGASRFLSDTRNWNRWWPSVDKGTIAGNDFLYNGYSYHPSPGLSYVRAIRIDGDETSVNSRMVFIPSASPDTSDVYWDCEIPTGLNPVARVIRYGRTRCIREGMHDILIQLGGFLEKKEHIYGLDVHKASTSDSFLVATRKLLPAEPSTADIYLLLGLLRRYVQDHRARETGNPMVNITKTGDGHYQVMTAIPVDRDMKSEGIIFSRKLIPGHYLMTEVRGGPATVNTSLQWLQAYISDYQITVMAIPFQSLVTDRSQEADTGRWVTRIYYPVY